MELQMQYTYKGVCISMLGIFSQSQPKEKHTVVLCHNSNRDWKILDCFYYHSIWCTQLQAIKQFMKMVHELNEGIINIKTN